MWKNKKRIFSLLLSAVMAVTLFETMIIPQTVYGADNVTEKATLSLNQPQTITIDKREDGDGYFYAYAFKTTDLKSYYSFTWSSNSDYNPEWYVSTTLSRTNKVIGGYVDNFQEIGGVDGTNPILNYNTTYYLVIARDNRDDITATIQLVQLSDAEPDTAALAEPLVPGNTKYARLDSTDDRDVYYLDTGSNTYTTNVSGTKKYLDFKVYSDHTLSNLVYSNTIEADGLSVDMTKYLQKNNRYYFVFKYYGAVSQSPKDTGIEYNITLTAQPGATTGATTDTPATTTKTTTTKKKTNYLKTKVYKTKYFVTNMGSGVSCKIKKGKLYLNRDNYGFLCKKSKMKNSIFTKSVNMTKKKYKFKLAKGCKVVYGTKEDGSGDVVKSTKWFNKNFKRNGAMYYSYDFGVCLNKKNQVTLIYVSYFDVGAEQT